VLIVIEAQHDAVAADTFCIGVHDVVLSEWIWKRVHACNRRGREGSGNVETRHGSVQVSPHSLRLHPPRQLSAGRRVA